MGQDEFATGVQAPGQENFRLLDSRRQMDSSLAQLCVPIAALRLYQGNPRRGNVDAIKESLEVNGQYRPLVVNRRTNEVLAGNHTLRAARELGWTKLAVVYVDADDEQAKRIVLVDNRTSDLAGYDDAELVALLEGLGDLAGSGYDEQALAELLNQTAPVELPGVDEQVPPRPAAPSTRPGDLYLLGEHRLLCGDATDQDACDRLLDGGRVDAMWTDPPYGVAYEGKTNQRLTIRGDGAKGLEQLLTGAFSNADRALTAGAPIYIAHPAGPQSATFANCFAAQGWSWRQTLVWVKDAFVLGRSDYHYRHEPILYGFKPGKGRLGRGGRSWQGGNAEQSVFEFARPRASREHPTMKPPELVAAALGNSSRRGGLVLDPFGGSGSTLIACEATGRKARMLELDPGYCDVIVARWEQLIGQSAQLERP